MGSLTEIKSSDAFKRAINGNRLCVVDFYATWCGPCKAVAPAFEALSKKYKACLFLKVDTDANQSVAQTCSVRAMPTFQLFHKGKKLDEVVGANISDVEAKVQKHLRALGPGSGGEFQGVGRKLGDGSAITADGGRPGMTGQVQGAMAQGSWVWVAVVVCLLYFWIHASTKDDHAAQRHW